MLHATHLQKSYGDHPVLRDASVSLDAGTVAAMIGPNGAGKTTTLHILAGLTTPDAGTATVAGVDITTNRTAAQEHLAFLPQDVRFHDALTPRQVLRFYTGLRQKPSARIGACLADVALTDAADQPCSALSGGMRQRLGIAVLELADAPVLLLDEPALSLDPEWRTFLMDRLRAHADDGATVLLATHLHDVWAPIVDRTLRCADGTITDVAPTTSTNEVAHAPAQPKT
jgi:heme ABC exporter ATP-binding subunit CcmA